MLSGRHLLGAMGVAAALAIAAPAYSQQQELRIGGIGSLSGGGTAWGLAIMRGTELAIDDVIAEGGLKVGDQVYKPSLVMVDDLYSGNGGKAGAERLLYQEKVKFIVGPLGSPPALATVGVLDEAREKDGIVAINLAGAAALGLLKNKYKAPFNFVIANTNREFAPALVNWYKTNYPALKKVAIIAPNDAVGQTIVPTLIEAYKQAGIEVWFEMFERGTKEFTPLITRMIAAGVNALDLDNNAPGEAGLLYRQAKQAGFRGMIWQTGGPGVLELQEIAGKASNGFLSYELYDADSPSGKKFVADYEKKYGKGVINGHTPIIYNAVKLLFEAMRRAGSVDPVKVRDALEKLSGYDPGVLGATKWGGMERYGVAHQLELPFFVVEIKDDKSVIRARLNP
jgi:branched-chain amino acid transport system substrate-binding protein